MLPTSTRREKELAAEIRFNLSKVSSLDTVQILRALQFDLEKAFQIGRTSAAPKYQKDCLHRVESLAQANKCSRQELACLVAAFQGVKTPEDSFFILLKILQSDLPGLQHRLGGEIVKAEQQPEPIQRPQQISVRPDPASLTFLETPSIEVREEDISPRKSQSQGRGVQPMLRSPSQSVQRTALSFLDSGRSITLLKQPAEASRVQFDAPQTNNQKPTRQERLERLRELKEQRSVRQADMPQSSTASHMTLQELCDSNMLCNTANEFPEITESVAVQTSTGFLRGGTESKAVAEAGKSRVSEIAKEKHAPEIKALVPALQTAQLALAQEIRARDDLVGAVDAQAFPYLKRQYMAILRIQKAALKSAPVELSTKQHTPLFAQYQKTLQREIDKLKPNRKAAAPKEKQTLAAVVCLNQYARQVATLMTNTDACLRQAAQVSQRYTALLADILAFKTLAAKRRRCQERILILRCQLE